MYQASHPNTIILSSDEVRKEVTGTYLDFTQQKKVWEVYESRIVEYGNKSGDFTLILDALNDLNVLRQKYAIMGAGFDKKVLVVIRKSFEMTAKKNKEREKDKWVPDDVLKALYEKFELPNQETIDMYDEYQFIDYFF